MPISYGSLKTNSLVLQGNSGVLKEDVSLDVSNDTLSMKMGDKTFMNVVRTLDDPLDAGNSDTNTTINIDSDISLGYNDITYYNKQFGEDLPFMQILETSINKYQPKYTISQINASQISTRSLRVQASGLYEKSYDASLNRSPYTGNYHEALYGYFRISLFQQMPEEVKQNNKVLPDPVTGELAQFSHYRVNRANSNVRGFRGTAGRYGNTKYNLSRNEYIMKNYTSPKDIAKGCPVLVNLSSLFVGITINEDGENFFTPDSRGGRINKINEQQQDHIYWKSFGNGFSSTSISGYGYREISGEDHKYYKPSTAVDGIASEISQYVEMECDEAKNIYSRNLNSYTIEKSWDRFVYGLTTFIGAIERVEYIPNNIPLNFSGINTLKIPNIQSKSMIINREYGTLSTGQFGEFCEYLKNNGTILQSTRIKSIKKSFNKNHLEFIYSPDMYNLPLNDSKHRYLEKSNITEYQLFPWGSHVKLLGNDVPEVLKDVDLLVSNKGTREQKIPDVQRGTLSEYYWNNFSQVTFKLPIILSNDKEFKCILNGKELTHIVPKGSYYIRDICNNLNDFLSPAVNCTFNYENNISNVVKFIVNNTSTSFKLVLPDTNYTGNVECPEDMELTRILGFTKVNTTAGVKTLYSLGDKTGSVYQSYLDNNDLVKFTLISKTPEQYISDNIYTTREEAWKQSELQAFSSSYNTRNYVCYNNGWGMGVTNGAFMPCTISILNTLALQDPLEFDSNEELTQACVDKLMSVEVVISNEYLKGAYNSNKLTSTRHKAVKIGKDVDNRLVIEFEMRRHNVQYNIRASTLNRLKEQIRTRDANNLPQFGMGNLDTIESLFPTNEDGTYIDYAIGTDGSTMLPGGDLTAFGGYFNGWSMVGNRFFLKLGLRDVEETLGNGPFKFIDKGELGTDEMYMLDSKYMPVWAQYFSVNGFPQDENEYIFFGHSYATDQYDGYPGIFNYQAKATGTAFTHPYPTASQSIYGNALALERNFAEAGTVGSTTVNGVQLEILYSDISEIKALVIENNENATESITDVKTSLVSEDIIDALLTLDLNTTDLKLYKKIDPLTNYCTIDNFLTACFQTYNVIQSEEHSSFTSLAREAGDGVKEYYPGLYSSIKNDWDVIQEGASEGGMVNSINNRCNLHVITEAENNTHGYDFTGELSDTGKKGQFWRYPQHYEWDKDELPDGHYLKNDLYGGMSYAGKIYRSISNMVNLYEIHVEYAQLPDTDAFGNSNIRGGDGATNQVDGSVRYTRFYGWPQFAKNSDPKDERQKSDQESVDECPLYGVFNDDVVYKMMENQPEFMEKWNAGERPRVGYYRQGSVYWSNVYSTKYLNSGSTAVLYARPDLKVHRLNFFNAIAEPIYKLFQDKDVQYILMDERQNLGGSFDDGFVLFSRLGEKRPINHSLELSPGWNAEASYNNRAAGRVVTFSEFSEFAKELYKLDRTIQDRTNYNIKEETLNLIPKDKFLTAEEFEDTILNFNPERIKTDFPYITEDGNVEDGPVLIGTSEKPIRILCNRSSVATSGGRLTGWNGVGKDGMSNLGKHCTFRQSGNWDRLFSTGGNYPYCVFDRETIRSLKREGNSYDLFAESARLEASGTLLFDGKNAKYMNPDGNVDIEDVRNYVMSSSTFDLPFNKVDFVLETGGYDTFFRSIGLTKQAVERLTKRKQYTINVSLDSGNLIYNNGTLVNEVEAEASYIFVYDKSITDFNIGIYSSTNKYMSNFLVEEKEEGNLIMKTFVIYKKHIGRYLMIGDTSMLVKAIGSLSGYKPVNILNSAWVKTNVGMEGIQNIDVEFLPISGDPAVIFEEPITHVDYYTIRNIQILLDQKTDNWTDMSSKYTTKEINEEQRAKEVKYGGIDLNKYYGTTPEGNKYPSEIKNLFNYGNLEFKTHNLATGVPYELFTGGLEFVDDDIFSGGSSRTESVFRKDYATIRGAVFDSLADQNISANLFNTEFQIDRNKPEV